MKLEGYKRRLIDRKVVEFIKNFGAVAIEGPKWCGKTWTSLKHEKNRLTNNECPRLRVCEGIKNVSLNIPILYHRVEL